MAQYQHLPIYKTTYELLQAVTRATAGHLELHPRKTSINRIEHGFDALGFVARPHARYVRRSTVRHAHAKLDGMCRAGASAAEVRDVANSYFSMLSKATAWRERRRLGDLLRRHGHRVAPQNNRMFTKRIAL